MTDLDIGYDDVAVRQPPHDLVAEASVLGGLLASKQARYEVLGAGVLTADDFYAPKHGTIYQAIVDLEKAGTPADAVTVAGHLQSAGELQRVGGHAYLHEVITTTPSSANAGYHARIVRERAVLRRLVAAGMHIQQLGFSPDGLLADEVTARARLALDEVGYVGQAQAAASVEEMVVSLVDNLSDEKPDQRLVWAWPWRDAQRLTNGVRPGQLVIFGARPSVGKSVAIGDCVREWCIHQGARMVLWTREMPAAEWMERLLSAESKVPLRAIQTKEIRDDWWPAIYAAMDRIAAAPLTVLDQGGTLADIVAGVRKHRAQAIGYDYLQLTPDADKAKDDQHRRMLLGGFAQGLKNVARDEDVAVVTAAQLNRGPEQRQSKVPVLGDFRETGSIEQAADIAILLHREDVHDKESVRAGEADLIFAKVRNGATDTVVVAFQSHLTRFVDMASERDMRP